MSHPTRTIPPAPFGQPRCAVVGYAGVHKRLQAWRGLASAMQCTRCDGPAAQWAYMGGDPDERTAPNGCQYSHDLDRYEPMCGTCHHRMDYARKQGRSEDVCLRGHLWAEHAAYRRTNGKRYCSECNRVTARAHIARKRQERAA